MMLAIASEMEAMSVTDAKTGKGKGRNGINANKINPVGMKVYNSYLCIRLERIFNMEVGVRWNMDACMSSKYQDNLSKSAAPNRNKPPNPMLMIKKMPTSWAEIMVPRESHP